jgi:hypothetical protein
MNFASFDKSYALKLKYYTHQKTPLLVPGVGHFSKGNSFLLDQLITKAKTDLKIFILSFIKSNFILDYHLLEGKLISI